MLNKKILMAYYNLIKPRIVFMQWVTVSMGYFLSHPQPIAIGNYLFLLIGTACVAAGSGILNNYLEKDSDSKMERTKNRPLPLGLIPPANALMTGILTVLGSVLLLLWQVNLLTAFLALLTAFLYVLVYTPMKKLTWLNTSVGAIPGAIPPLGGWAAATGTLSLESFFLFLILFAWQHPHFYAIAWMLKEDYRKAGFKMLPVLDPTGHRTYRQILYFSILLILLSLALVKTGNSGTFYGWGACGLGLLILYQAIRFGLTKSDLSARKLLKITVYYLPLYLVLLLIDTHLHPF